MDEPRTYLSGGFLSDAMDILGTGAYGIAGAARGGSRGQPLGQSFIEGVKHRTSWRDVLSDNIQVAQTPARRFIRNAVGTGLDILLDPAWLLTPAKVAGVVAKPLRAGYGAAKGVKALRPLAEGAEGLVHSGAQKLARMGFQTTEEMRRLKSIQKGVAAGLQGAHNEIADFVRDASKLSQSELAVVSDLIDVGAPLMKEVPKAASLAPKAAGATADVAKVVKTAAPVARAAQAGAEEGLPFAARAATEEAAAARKIQPIGRAMAKQPGIGDIREVPGMAAPHEIGGVEVGVSKGLRKPGATVTVPGLEVGRVGAKVAEAAAEFIPEARPTMVKAAIETETRRVRQDAQAVATARAAILRRAAVSGMDTKKLQQYMFKATSLDDKLGRLLVDNDLMTKETFDLWQGGHLRRLYMMFENPEEYVKTIKDTAPLLAAEIQSSIERNAPFRQGSKPAKGAKAVHAREEIDTALREGMGEVKDIAYRAGRQGVVTLGAVQKKRVLDEVAKAFATEVKPGMNPLQMGLRVFPEDARAWGALAGKAVPEAVYNDLNFYARKPEAWQRLSSKLVGAWKYGKTILNPATFARNAMSNFLLADAVAGLPIYRVDIYANALKDLATKSELWQEVRNNTTLLRNTFAQRELGLVMDSLVKAKTPTQGIRSAAEKLLEVSKKTAGGAASAYQFVEEWGKMAVYRFARGQGKSVEEAAKLAEKALFDYGDVPRWIEMLRSGRLGPATVPFATFSYKAVPAMVEAAMKNPGRITRWAKGMAGVESLAGTPAQNAMDRAVLPGYAKEGQWVKLPVKDKNGDNLWLDMTYILPMNDLNEASGILGTGAQPGLMSLPFIDAFGDITRNKSRFTGRPIWRAGATRAEIQGAVVTYLTDFLAPPLLGKNLRNIVSAWRDIPDWDGRQRSLTSALAGAFAGLKTRSFDVGSEYVSRVREIQRKIADTRAHLRSVLGDPRVSEKQKDKVWQDALRQIDVYVEALDALTAK